MGAAGRFLGFSGQQQRLTTCVWQGGAFCQATLGTPFLFALEQPDGYAFSSTDHSWTGRTLRYAHPQGCTLELRSTLPGPHFTLEGTVIRLVLGGARGMRDLERGASFDLGHLGQVRGGRRWLLEGAGMPLLLVCSAPLSSVHLVSHTHLTLEFASVGARFYLVPLLDRADTPTTPEQFALWERLLEKPPLEVQERYRRDGEALELQSTFADADLAPLPGQLSLMRASTLVEVPDAPHTLLSGLTGPYHLLEGNRTTLRVQLGWTRARLAFASEAQGPLEPLPEELVYAGDWSWNLQTSVMDRLLSLRTWAGLFPALPQVLRDTLVAQLALGDPHHFRDSLEHIPILPDGSGYLKERTLFGEKGTVSWDMDWYAGLILAGLARAALCADSRVSGPARAFARATRLEREGLARYFSLFHDWSHGMAWTDARGLFSHHDCAHHGLEGLLGEAELRRLEGDDAGAEWAEYLAARTAVALLAGFVLDGHAPTVGYQLPDTDRRSHFLRPGRIGDESFGINTLLANEGVATITSSTPNPYSVVGHFPQYQALLREHAPVQRLERLAQLWAERHPERYSDWVAFYIGSDPEEIRRKFVEDHDQEARVQASVFYHLAPEVTLRLLVLEENPAGIEGRYATPLNLAEQVLLRSGAHLERG